MVAKASTSSSNNPLGGVVDRATVVEVVEVVVDVDVVDDEVEVDELVVLDAEDVVAASDVVDATVGATVVDKATLVVEVMGAASATGAMSGALLPPGRGAANRKPPTVTTPATATKACHLIAPKNAADRRTHSSSLETIRTPERGWKSLNGPPGSGTATGAVRSARRRRAARIGGTMATTHAAPRPVTPCRGARLRT